MAYFSLTFINLRVFEGCIGGGLLEKTTRVLVSNDVDILPFADNIVIMGRNETTGVMSIQAQGSLRSLLQSRALSSVIGRNNTDELNTQTVTAADFAAGGLGTAACPITDHQLSANSPVIFPNSNSESATSANIDVDMTAEIGTEKGLIVSTSDCFALDGKHDALINPLVEEAEDGSSPLPFEAVEEMAPLAAEEERHSGPVQADVYLYYLRSSRSIKILLCALFSVVAANLSVHSQQWAVARWAMDSGYTQHSLPHHLARVGALAVLTGLINWMRTWLFYRSGTAASATIHKNMLQTMLNAPLSFFETTPVGRIMTRFSRDLDSVDNQLPTVIAHLAASFFQALASILSIMSVTPSFGALLPPMLSLYYLVTRNFVTISSELRHLEATTRSPILSHYSETLSGLSIVQSFGEEDYMQRENEGLLNKNSEASFALKVAHRWVSLRLEILGNLLVFGATLLAMYKGSSAGASGVSLNNALATTGLLNWLIRNWADTQALMHSVEKLRQFHLDTPVESTLARVQSEGFITNSHNISLLPKLEQNNSAVVGNDAWPWKGDVVFQNVSLRYRADLEPVLRSVSFHVSAGDTVGIVGRSGSGKSSLFRGLLRLTELEQGSVFIDGVDVSSVALPMLRSRISIIPQDPHLFSGTVRSNIDPHNSMDDKELWTVLRKAHLYKLVKQFPLGLDQWIQEGGGIFSSGQKQLFCMAR